MRKASVHDIAKYAKVSAMTVVRAFNGSAPVSQKTRKKIMETAKRLNYYPNALAKGMNGQRTKTVGLIFNAATPETTADNINIVVGELQCKDHLPYIMTFTKWSELNLILKNYICQRVDGVIIWSDYPPFPYYNETAELLDNFNASVFITSQLLRYTSDQVIRSPFKAINDVVDHLVASGRKNPSIFTALPVNQTKADAFIERLKSHSLKISENTVIDSMLKPGKSCYDIEFPKALEKQFGKIFPFDALLITGDDGAAATMKYLKLCNVKIPEDIAVVGYNNYGWVDFLSPPLASIDPNFKESAINSVEMLLNRLSDKCLPQQIKELPLTFVWRKSAGGEISGAK